ncbi:hypothetical protein ACE7GA_03640 [Roseomonas sp. CCTCC AB2023176]|uniref:hypothetical protein n=1 Tax=Roseomonas sp. CCTCC AB2023176 TaxID=3342640 RepID=UPI0035DC8BCB
MDLITGLRALALGSTLALLPALAFAQAPAQPGPQPAAPHSAPGARHAAPHHATARHAAIHPVGAHHASAPHAVLHRVSARHAAAQSGMTRHAVAHPVSYRGDADQTFGTTGRLHLAMNDLRANRLGAAQVALDDAETPLLNAHQLAMLNGKADASGMALSAVEGARVDLGPDRAGAARMTHAALRDMRALSNT